MKSRPVPPLLPARPSPLAFALVAALGVALGAPGAVRAQADGGLKLGEEPPPAPTLDLGAGPAVPPAPPPDASTGAPSPGGATPRAADPGAARDPAAIPADAERTTYGSWEVACAPNGGACAMAQVGNDATGTPVLEMVLRKLAEPITVKDQTAVAVLDVITPLGVVLTEGVKLKIDAGREESGAFQICTEQGCLVREPIGDDLVQRLKRGSVARVSVVAANQGEVSSELSLNGFTKAYESTR